MQCYGCEIGCCDALGAMSHAVLIERHECLEGRQIAFGIIGGRQKSPKNARPYKDEWLATFPIGAQRGQGLRLLGVALLLRFNRDLGAWPNSLDHRGSIAQGVSLNFSKSGGRVVAHVHQRSSKLIWRLLSASTAPAPSVRPMRIAFRHPLSMSSARPVAWTAIE